MEDQWQESEIKTPELERVMDMEIEVVLKLDLKNRDKRIEQLKNNVHSLREGIRTHGTGNEEAGDRKGNLER